MIWVLVAAGALLAGGVALVGGYLLGSRLVAGLLATGSVVVIVFVSVALATPTSPEPVMGGFSHAQLEADRLMTQQMAIVVGPAMDAQMLSDGMLARSANEAYLRALEQHVYEVDRMLGAP